MKASFGIGCLVALVLVVVGPGSALASQGFGMSPTTREISLRAGETTTGTITIINDGDSDVTYKLYVTDYRVHDDSYKGDFTSSQSAANVSPIAWFKLAAGTAVIKSRQQAEVPYSITAPVGASVGGHYAALFAETVPPAPKGGAVVARIDRVGALFYIAVGGDVHPSGSVVGLSMPWYIAVSPITAELRLKNDGNSHYSADVTTQLETPFGKAGHPYAMRGEVLPSTTRRFDLSLPAPMPVGLYKLTATATYLSKTQSVSSWVVVMPTITLVILITTVAIIGLLLLWWALRRLGRQRRRRG
jgi:hypothetical protein